MTISLCVPHLEITIVVEQWKWKYKHNLFVDSTYLSESPLSNQTNIQTDSDNTDHYDSVMQWLNQQACGGTVKRKRKINKQQVRNVLELHETRSCGSKLNLKLGRPRKSNTNFFPFHFTLEISSQHEGEASYDQPEQCIWKTQRNHSHISLREEAVSNPNAQVGNRLHRVHGKYPAPSHRERRLFIMPAGTSERGHQPEQ